jgi:Flp pilus assembly protein TadD
VIAHDPAHFDALRLSGLVHAQTGAFEPAAARLMRAIVVNPNDAATQAHLGAALNALGRPLEALSSLTAAISADPSSPYGAAA